MVPSWVSYFQAITCLSFNFSLNLAMFWFNKILTTMVLIRTDSSLLYQLKALKRGFQNILKHINIFTFDLTLWKKWEVRCNKDVPNTFSDSLHMWVISQTFTRTFSSVTNIQKQILHFRRYLLPSSGSFWIQWQCWDMTGLMGCILNHHLYFFFGLLVKDYSTLQNLRRNA